jgi:hypothetical protein
MSGIMNVTSTRAGDTFAVNIGQADDPSDAPAHPLATPEELRNLRRFEEWWLEARDAHATNRREQMIDADYYDCDQWRLDEAAILMERGQAPLTFPLVKQMCDWVIGTERRTRIDWNVLPRKGGDVKIAGVKRDVLKFISDVNGAGWERSLQFEDQIKVGVGWTEECYNNDRYEEPVSVRHQDWKGMWWDPYSRSNTLRDCRYLHRAKWTDLDYAIAMCPDRADELERKAVDTLDPVLESLELEASLPQMFYSSPLATQLNGATAFGLFGSTAVSRRARRRVLMIETWYRRAVNSKIMLGDSADDAADGLRNKVFDPSIQAHKDALNSGAVSLMDSVSEEMWFAIWTPGLLLKHQRSPYKHRKFPFTPAWCFRRHRDGMPYGLIRPARDSQDEYNKRRSKILFDLSTNRVLYEVGAMDEADEHRNLEEAKRPDGEIRLAQGALREGAFKIERATDAINGQIQMLEEARNNVFEASGVTRENTGQSTGDQSGRAILAKQQQGSVTTAAPFDNFRQAIQESGQKTLSNCEQFLSLPKIIRIAGPDGAADWLKINEPVFDPTTGDVLWENDITASEADFVVDETDYRETVRMAMAEMLFELIGRLPPDLAVAMLDMAVDLTDLPNKQAIVNRIRQITGQSAPGQEDSPEAQAQAQAQADAQQRQQAMADAKAQADIELTQAKTAATNAKATLDQTSAQRTAVQGKADAMQTAGMVHAAPQVAPAADRLWNPSEALPMRPDNYVPLPP